MPKRTESTSTEGVTENPPAAPESYMMKSQKGGYTVLPAALSKALGIGEHEIYVVKGERTSDGGWIVTAKRVQV